MKRDELYDTLLNQRLHDIVNAIHNYDIMDILTKLFNSQYGIALSKGNGREVISSYHEAYKFINHWCGGYIPSKKDYDKVILNWMCDVYWTMFVKYEYTSQEAYNIITPEKLYDLYNPLHETSEVNCVRKILNESLSVFERMRQAALNGEIITQPFTIRYKEIVLPLVELGWLDNYLHWSFRTDDNIDITVIQRMDGFELEMRLHK